MDWTRLPLSRDTTDRAAHRRTDPDLVRDSWAAPGTRVVLVHGAAVATTADRAALDLANPAEVADPGLVLFLGADESGDLMAVVREDPDPDRTWSGLRDCGHVMGDRDSGLATTALALAAWHARHPCCSRCGAATEPALGGWTRRCPQDGSEHYPRTDPAVIMAITDADDRLLLAHGAAWPERRFSTLAGYLEPGETPEHAVVREVAEETAVRVVDPQYRGSQPWPFPASLMLAYTARAVTTQITVDATEVTQAHWFSRAALAAAVATGDVVLPTRTSVARALIEDWYGGPLDAGDAPR
ncbi:NAD(+) diphosphatase [Isoptericola sp. b441]|uniref:NAD(+) diphosphatase n=1 Tax=Actinotalea lenta TaxID=3064654 RepID=A0ABT9DBR5_9CELL|nr:MULTISPECIES: NAD(+) diphosphatase [unclassified Isoptericola]MDO8108301.1 NAD(+) diphosphatase [Isoptericola sp. b441]MDO8122686.1 NAD(+) diphosphatase [Isoptericola sp. b490]